MEASHPIHHTRLLHTENTLNAVLQVALAIITITGLTIATLSYFSYLAPAKGYWGISIASAALLSLILLRHHSLSPTERSVIYSRNLDEILEFVRSGTAKATLLGDLYLEIPNKGKVPVDKLTKRVMELGSKPQLTNEEREIGQILTKQINQAYLSIERAHTCAYTNYFLREFPWTSSSPRNRWCSFYADDLSGRFNMYTDTEYEQAFSEKTTGKPAYFKAGFPLLLYYPPKKTKQ